MAKTITVRKLVKGGEEKGSFEMSIPESFEECATLPGAEKALVMVINQMKIEARAKHFPPEAKGGLVSKGTMSAIRGSIKGGEFTEEDLIAFIKARRG